MQLSYLALIAKLISQNYKYNCLAIIKKSGHNHELCRKSATASRINSEYTSTTCMQIYTSV